MTPNELLQSIFEEAPAYLIVFEGPELRIARVNRLARERFSEQLKVGRLLRELVPPGALNRQAIERVYATGVPEAAEQLQTHFPEDAGESPYFTRRYVPLRDASGAIHGVLSVSLDVTEDVQRRLAYEENDRRRESEHQRLYALFEEAHVLINVLEGPELRVVMMNRRLREVSRGREIMGRSLRDLLPPTNRTLQAAERVLTTGVAETYEEISADMPPVAGQSLSVTVAPIHDPDGRITRVVNVSVDTTDHRLARDALVAQARDLEDARREAVEANRAKDDFLAMLGHELRNPLAPIVSTLELMRLRGERSLELDVLERQVRHLTRLVDDLLDVSRITHGRIELERRTVDVALVVERALELSRPLIEQRRQRVVTDLDAAAVDVDLDRLSQAVANLLANAAKYSELGSEIRLRARRAGQRLRLIVEDDGIGITAEMLGRVFDAFVQQPQAPARPKGGLGLGLSIVKSLVEAHGGVVSAHSDGPGRGSAFVIELPLAERPAVDADGERSERQRLPDAPARRILVVEDNRDVALMLATVLERMGHVVARAHDGPAALALAATFAPDIALLDIGLPGMDGYQLGAALRAGHDVRLVAVTGYGQEHDRKRSRAAGFEAHLVKPVDLTLLQRLLARSSPSR
jgi:signal transduction histidine kinase/CheY-like chemotaxis protein